MEPKTKFQKFIFSLHKKLPPISEKQNQWAYDHCVDHYAKLTKKGLVCLDCGYIFRDSGKSKKCICPDCKRTLKIDRTTKRVFKDTVYFGITTTFKGFQLFRLFFIQARLQYNKKPEYSCHEVVQRWIGSDGKNVTLSVPRYSNFIYFDIWNWRRGMEIKKLPHRVYDTIPYKTYPAAKYLKAIKRNGFTGEYHGISKFDFFCLILSNNVAETFLKLDEIDWLRHTYYQPRIVLKSWPAIKIALRHKQVIKDKHLWLDYIQLLQYFKKDIRNPLVIFPSDLHKVHDDLVRKKRKIMAAIETRKKEKLSLEENENYQKSRSKYFGICFSDGLIEVKTLQNIEEFKTEGDTLHHCIYTNGYYKKKNSLILSARIDGKSIETVEVLLDKLKINQCRGTCNQNSDYHDRIIQLVENNMPLIQNARKQRNTQKQPELLYV